MSILFQKVFFCEKLCYSLRKEILQLTSVFGARHETPIVLSAKLPQYPSITEIDYGFTVSSPPEPIVIHRHFGEVELSIKTIEGWNGMRQLLVKYYKLKKKTANIGCLDERFDLEKNLWGTISHKETKKNTYLTIRLTQPNGIQIDIFPRAISALAGSVFDQINDNVIKIFKSSVQAKSFVNVFTNALYYHTDAYAIKVPRNLIKITHCVLHF